MAVPCPEFSKPIRPRRKTSAILKEGGKKGNLFFDHRGKKAAIPSSQVFEHSNSRVSDYIFISTSIATKELAGASAEISRDL